MVFSAKVFCAAVAASAGGADAMEWFKKPKSEPKQEPKPSTPQNPKPKQETPQIKGTNRQLNAQVLDRLRQQLEDLEIEEIEADQEATDCFSAAGRLTPKSKERESKNQECKTLLHKKHSVLEKIGKVNNQIIFLYNKPLPLDVIKENLKRLEFEQEYYKLLPKEKFNEEDKQQQSATDQAIKNLTKQIEDLEKEIQKATEDTRARANTELIQDEADTAKYNGHKNKQNALENQAAKTNKKIKNNNAAPAKQKKDDKVSTAKNTEKKKDDKVATEKNKEKKTCAWYWKLMFMC